MFTDHADCQVYYCPRCKTTFSPREINSTDETQRPPCPDCREKDNWESLDEIRMDSAIGHMENCNLDEAKVEYQVLGWRTNGTSTEIPDGVHIEDYFQNGRYIGPDTDGEEPVLHIRYEDGVHTTQQFTNEHTSGWLLIGYDGVRRDIPDEGEIADAFAERVQVERKK